MRKSILLQAAAVAVLACWLSPAAPVLAAPTVVDAGSLRATVSADPWGLAFVDRRGAPVLSEHPGTGPTATGTLGFRAAGVWRHATRVVSSRREGGAYLAELATTDPTGRRLELRLEPGGEGVIGLDARVTGPHADLEAVGIAFAARGGERYLGFGERSNAVDQTGNEVENYVSDGPYQPEERPFLEAFIPPWGFRERDDATYFPVPWLLSTAGYGVLIDNPETSYFRLGEANAWGLEVNRAPVGEPGGEGGPRPSRLSLRVFAGPRPADALRRFTAATGRQPPPAAPWYFGPWVQPTGDDELEQVARLRRADAPLSVAQTYLHYLPCGDQQGRRDAERRRTAAFHGAGLAVTTYFNPMICESYEPFDRAAAAGALTRNRLGDPYLYRYSTASQFLVGQFDFLRKAGRDLYAALLREAVDDGHDGWMEDFGEYTPLDSESGDGVDGTRVHNPYPTRYHCTAYDFARRAGRPLARFQRSGWTGSAPCAQVVWGGDPTTGWGFDGLASAVKQALSIGLSGISTWGSDIGGFFALGRNRLTPELLKRWVQFGAVSGVMRTQANGIALPPKERPQVWDDDQLANWRRYAKLRTQLYPYLAAADADYRQSGLPLMRQLALAYPGDARAAAREDQFLFGPDLLAAPVLEPDARRRELYLPAGEWVDVWRAVAYDARSGGLELGEAEVASGARSVSVPAPLDELPLLARAGTLLPLLPPDVDTLADYGDDPGLVKLGERRGRLELLAFPRGESDARLYEGARLASRERRGRWELAIRDTSQRSYRLQASMRTLRQDLRPCRLTLAGRPLPAEDWRYDERRGVLSARFRARAATLVASGGCGGSGERRRQRGVERPASRGAPIDTTTGQGSADVGGFDDSEGADDGELPFTGLTLALLALLGALLLELGRRLRGGRPG